MSKNDIITATEEFVKTRLVDFDSGHNWWHIERVRNLSLYINTSEGLADPFLIDISALMHDVADSKFSKGDDREIFNLVETFLGNNGLDKQMIEKVFFVMKNISYSSGDRQASEMTRELIVVQDADRLDAMGAIGIARAFNYGGFRNREIYIPGEIPKLSMSKEKFKKSNPSTINHFYEKLLLLKGLMNTSTGRRLADDRHQFMELYLQTFFNEWNFK
jgi:uncharacterized protein